RLLAAGWVGYGLRVGHRYAVGQVGNRYRDVGDQIGDPRHVLVVDVFRLVGHLVVVGVQAGGKERDGDSVAGVLIVVRATVNVGRMPVRIDRVVEHQAVALRRVDPLHQIAQLGREAARAYELQVAGTAVQRRSVLCAPP